MNCSIPYAFKFVTRWDGNPHFWIVISNLRLISLKKILITEICACSNFSQFMFYGLHFTFYVGDLKNTESLAIPANFQFISGRYVGQFVWPLSRLPVISHLGDETVIKHYGKLCFIFNWVKEVWFGQLVSFGYDVSILLIVSIIFPKLSVISFQILILFR